LLGAKIKMKFNGLYKCNGNRFDFDVKVEPKNNKKTHDNANENVEWGNVNREISVALITCHTMD